MVYFYIIIMASVFNITDVYDALDYVRDIDENMSNYLRLTTMKTILDERNKTSTIMVNNIHKDKNKSLIIENLNKLNDNNIENIYENIFFMKFENLDEFKLLISLFYSKLCGGNVASKELYCKLCNKLVGFTYVSNDNEIYIFENLLKTYVKMQYDKLSAMVEDDVGMYKQVLSVISILYRTGILSIEIIHKIMMDFKKITTYDENNVGNYIFGFELLCIFLDELLFDEYLYGELEGIDNYLKEQINMYGKKLPLKSRIKIDNTAKKIVSFK